MKKSTKSLVGGSVAVILVAALAVFLTAYHGSLSSFKAQVFGIPYPSMARIPVAPVRINGQTVKGVIVSNHVDIMDATTHKLTDVTNYVVRLPSGKEVFFGGITDSRMEPGATIEVKLGTNGMLASSSDIVSVMPSAIVRSSQPAQRSGPITRHVSVVMYKYQDDTTAPFAKDDVRKLVFEKNPSFHNISIGDFFSASSYGQIQLAGKTSANGSTDVWGFYTIPENRTGGSSGCKARNDMMYGNEPYTAIQDAVNDGMVIGDWDIIIVGTWPGNCGNGGQAKSGTKNSYVLVTNLMDWWDLLHEIGHSIGNDVDNPGLVINHANSLQCFNSKMGSTTFENADYCNSVEYGNPYDIMGSAGTEGNVHLFASGSRAGSGFMPSSDYFNITSSGTYHLKSVGASSATYPRIALITPMMHTVFADDPTVPPLAAPIRTILVESRNFNAYEQSAGMTPPDGSVFIRYDNVLVPTNTSGRLFLPVGSTYTDAKSGVTIKNLGPSSLGDADIQVTLQPLPVCVKRKPTVVITPHVQMFDTTHLFAPYTVTETMKNNNSDCQGDGFRVYVTNQFGSWDKHVDYTPIASGESFTTSFHVNSLPAQDKIYKVDIQFDLFTNSYDVAGVRSDKSEYAEGVSYIVKGIHSYQDLVNAGVYGRITPQKSVTPAPGNGALLKVMPMGIAR